MLTTSQLVLKAALEQSSFTLVTSGPVGIGKASHSIRVLSEVYGEHEVLTDGNGNKELICVKPKWDAWEEYLVFEPQDFVKKFQVQIEKREPEKLLVSVCNPAIQNFARILESLLPIQNSAFNSIICTALNPKWFVKHLAQIPESYIGKMNKFQNESFLSIWNAKEFESEEIDYEESFSNILPNDIFQKFSEARRKAAELAVNDLQRIRQAISVKSSSSLTPGAIHAELRNPQLLEYVQLHLSELIAEGRNEKMLQAFISKESDPIYKKMTNAEISEAFGLEQTEYERAVQDLKISVRKKLQEELAKPQDISNTKIEQSEDGISVNITKSVQAAPQISERTVDAGKAFGIGVDSTQQFQIFDNLELDIRKGDVVYITGDSGSGKSMLLKELKPVLEKNFGKVVCEGNPSLQTTTTSDDEIVIEGIGSNFSEAVKILSSAGLAEAFIMMRSYKQLSDGQKYRYRIAKTINDKDAEIWMFDEFLAVLDRESAKAVAYTLQSSARKLGKSLVVATTHDDLLEDLNPSLYVKKLFGSEVKVQRFEYKKKACSLLDEVVIAEGTREEFEQLEKYHYKGGSMGFLKRIYIAKIHGSIIGGATYIAPGAALAGRNIALPEYKGMTSEAIQILNRDFLRIARVIVIPKYRGIGLAVRLLKETLPATGYPFIEAIAIMAQYNPFNEHAGMTRITVPSVEERDPAYGRSLEKLAMLGFEIDMLTSATINLAVLERLDEDQINEVRKIVKKHFYKGAYSTTFINKPIDEMTREDLSQALTHVKLEMAYLIWKNPSPKFKELPDIRVS